MTILYQNPCKIDNNVCYTDLFLFVVVVFLFGGGGVQKQLQYKCIRSQKLPKNIFMYTKKQIKISVH